MMKGACSFYSIYITYYTLMYTLKRTNKHALYGVDISQQKNNWIKSCLQLFQKLCLLHYCPTFGFNAIIRKTMKMNL